MAIGEEVQFLKVGDLVVPTVRRGCVECDACAVGLADLCFTGRIRERGIVGLHGFLSERIVYHEENLIYVPAELAEVGPLVESLCTPRRHYAASPTLGRTCRLASRCTASIGRWSPALARSRSWPSWPCACVTSRPGLSLVSRAQVELSVGMLSALGPNGVLDLVGGPPEQKAVRIHAAALGRWSVGI